MPTSRRSTRSRRRLVRDDDRLTGSCEFLSARIAEDEATARAAFHLVEGQSSGGWYWDGAGDAVFLDHTADPVACGPWQQGVHQPSAHHVVRWDPERVVAECAAERRTVPSCAAALAAPPLRRRLLAGTVNQDSGRRELADRSLRLLALPCADHPGHRQEWRP